MARLDASILRAIAPLAPQSRRARQTEIINAVGAVLSATLANYQINTPKRVAHFLAQCAHECAAFSTTEEFADGSQYEGRADLGNTHPGDGRRYKGRGLIQLTGRFNYRKFGAKMNLPLEDQPLTAAQPAVSLTIACEYWKDRGLNAFADNDDIITITKRINGGLNGLDDRKNYLAKAKAALAGVSMPGPGGGAPQGPGPVAGTGSAGNAPLNLAAVAAGDPLLKRGDNGDDVAQMQSLLVAKGGEVDITGDFDEATEKAVIAFQQQHGLDDDGVVGEKTWGALRE